MRTGTNPSLPGRAHARSSNPALSCAGHVLRAPSPRRSTECQWQLLRAPRAGLHPESSPTAPLLTTLSACWQMSRIDQREAGVRRPGTGCLLSRR